MKYLSIVFFFAIILGIVSGAHILDYVAITKNLTVLRKNEVAVMLLQHQRDLVKVDNFMSKAELKVDYEGSELEYFKNPIDFSTTRINLLNNWIVDFQTKSKGVGGKLQMKIKRPTSTRKLVALSPPQNISQFYQDGERMIKFVFDNERKTFILTIPFFPLWNSDLVVHQEKLDISTFHNMGLKNSYSFYSEGIYFYWEQLSTTAVRLLAFHESVPLAKFGTSSDSSVLPKHPDRNFITSLVGQQPVNYAQDISSQFLRNGLTNISLKLRHANHPIPSLKYSTFLASTNGKVALVIAVVLTLGIASTFF